MAKFVYRKPQERRPSVTNRTQAEMPEHESIAEDSGENKNKKKKDTMRTTEEKVALANSILEGESKVKRLKKDRGLIERTESSKIVLTEDNKELLVD